MTSSAKVAIVTGARGIGLACAKSLARDGYDILLVCLRQDVRAKEAAEALEKSSKSKVVVVKADLATADGVETVFQVFKTSFGGGLFAIVHAHAIAHRVRSKNGLPAAGDSEGGKGDGDRIEDFDELDFYQNLYPKSFIRLVEEGVSYMKSGGRFVTFSAPGCNNDLPPRPWYFFVGQAKATLEYMVRWYASRLAPQQITVNTIIPGFIASEGWDKMRSAIGEATVDAMCLTRTPMHRWGTSDEIGDLAAYLCSDRAGFITGNCIYIDGGLHVDARILQPLIVGGTTTPVNASSSST